MPRSEEGKRKRLEYTRAWRKAHPEYHKKWRAEHKEEERERTRNWKLAHRDLVLEQKRRYHQRHRIIIPEVVVLPPKFVGHPYFDAARFICGDEPYFDWWCWEEAMGYAVLALVEGTDPYAAVTKARKYEKAWSIRHPPLYDNVDLDETYRVVFKKAHDS